MTFPLASGHENRQKAPATAMSDALPAPAVVFREIPLLVEIEQWIGRERGVTWRPEFERRVDEVSVALFGMKRYPKPVAASFNYEGAFRVAEYEWEQWYSSLDIPPVRDDGGYDVVDYLQDLGIDIWDADDNELRCAEWFRDQAIASVLEIGGARFTPDGSGERASQDAEEWGSRLAAEAAGFRSGGRSKNR